MSDDDCHARKGMQVRRARTRLRGNDRVERVEVVCPRRSPSGSWALEVLTERSANGSPPSVQIALAAYRLSIQRVYRGAGCWRVLAVA